MRFRTAIEDAVYEIDPQGKDPALRQIVLIGHNQGGLLAKMLVIDSGSRLWDSFSSKPLEELSVSPQTRELLRRAVFVTPVQEVRRVIFIATPQQLRRRFHDRSAFGAPGHPADWRGDGPRRNHRRETGRRALCARLGRIWQRVGR